MNLISSSQYEIRLQSLESPPFEIGGTGPRPCGPYIALSSLVFLVGTGTPEVSEQIDVIVCISPSWISNMG